MAVFKDLKDGSLVASNTEGRFNAAHILLYIESTVIPRTRKYRGAAKTPHQL